MNFDAMVAMIGRELMVRKKFSVRILWQAGHGVAKPQAAVHKVRRRIRHSGLKETNWIG